MSSHASPSHLPAYRYALDEQGILADLTLPPLEDTHEVPSRQKGKGREAASLTDSELALRIFSEDASDLARFNDDHAFAQRLSQTWELLDCENDWASDYTSDLARFNSDRALARRLSENWTPIPQPPMQNTHTHRTETKGWFRSFASFLVHSPGSTMAQHINARPEFSQPKLTTPTCVICQEPIRRGPDIRVPCGHHYDRSCAVDLFEAATRDESLFPPRCCKQTIPFAEVKPHVSAGFIKLFTEKVIEFGTLKRVYCASRTCSRFLGPQTMGWFGTTYTCKASGCRTVTCGRCRMKITPGVRHTCKIDDELDQQVLALGQQHGWARCPGCAQMIELNAGCFHMTCMCKTQFCYLCQATWKTCGCPQWEEGRLLIAAEERVDAQLGLPRHHEPPNVAPARAIPRAGRRLPEQADPAQIVRHQPYNPPELPPAVPRAGRRIPAPPNPIHADLREPMNLMPLPPIPARSTLRRSRTTTASSSKLRKAPVSSPGRNKIASFPVVQRNMGQDDDALALRGASPQSWKLRQTPTVTSSSSISAAQMMRRFSAHDVSDAAGPENATISRQDTAPSTTSLHVHGNTNKLLGRRAQLVREAVAHLRANHDCQHDHWKYRFGAGQCQTCRHSLPILLYRCLQCHTLACRRCRQNRL